MGRFEEKFINGKRIQAAIVEIYKQGLFYDVYKVDYSGFYPGLIMSFNISPETTKLIGYKEYQTKLTFQKTDNNEIIFEIPDYNLYKTCLIKIDYKEKGFLPQKLIEFKEIRDKVKILLKQKGLSDQQQIELNSTSWAYKILANSTGYGTNANAFFRYGDISLAIAITGLARYYITHVLDMYPDNKIEVDTDGVYLNKKVDIDMVNFEIKHHTQKTFGIALDKIKLELDLDHYDGAFFYKTKNYILWKHNKIIRHGVTFLSSRSTDLFNLCIESIAKAKFEKRSINDTLRNVVFKTKTLKDFSLKTSINKPLKSYKNQNCLQIQLARQAKQHLGQDVRVGDSIDYVKVNNGYKIIAMAKLKDIDIRYYYDQLQKVINIFTDEKITIENGTILCEKTLENW